MSTARPTLQRLSWAVIPLAFMVSCSDSATSGGSNYADVVASADTTGSDASSGAAVSDGAGGADTASVSDATVASDAVIDTVMVEEVAASPDVSTSLDTLGSSDVAEEDETSQDPDATVSPTPDGDGASDAGDAEGSDVSPPLSIGEQCFSEILDPEHPGPNYDQFAPTVGSHCVGTNHQDITGIEQVVILGDSVTQGSPNDLHPTCLENEHFYRNELSEWLADTYDLDRGDLLGWGLFKAYNCLYDGTAGQQTSGDFHNCSKWGARTDDFVAGGGQIPQCFPSYPGFGSDKKTLVFFTMGGNDISNISQVGSEASAEEVAAGYPTAWAMAESTVGYLEEAVAFFKDPAMFPSGAHVVFANPFEFTDGTGQTSACSPSEINIPFVGTIDISDFGIDLAGLAGYGAWEDQSVQEAIVIWILEQYLRIAVDYQVDLVWLLESFCGHGFVATGPDADPESRCYRGPDTQLYFDVTCIHPNDAGHHALSELFKAVIAE